jgi:hypothetical protein
MLVYMLVLSSLGMFIWATAWGSEFNFAPIDSSSKEYRVSSSTAVKYELGWMMLPAPYGARPWPSVMFPARFKSYNRPLTIIMSSTSFTSPLVISGFSTCSFYQPCLY